MVDVSIVVPCYNESEGLGQLRQKLVPALRQVPADLNYEVLLIDDGSTDDTYMQMQKHFSDLPYVRFVRHDRNQNLGAAIRTGMREAQGEWVSFLDSDCTYDPQLIKPMLERMREGADVVTLSPYHPRGRVIGVPAYRLFLSKGLSFIYRLILRQRIYTYTAMARTYRKSVFTNISSPKNDFSSVAEIMLNALKTNLKVVEVPADLAVRQFGESKMKVARVIRAHLKLVARLLFRPRSFLS